MHPSMKESASKKIKSAAELFLQNRYVSFKKTSLKEMVKIFDYKEWGKSFTENKKWGLEDVKYIAAYYYDHHFITEEEKVTAPRHWIPFRNNVMKSPNDKPIDVYSDLLRERDDNLSRMMVLLERMITVSAGTAACERGFSCINRQKINTQTSLSQPVCLDDVLRICIDDCGLKQFEAEKNINHWMDIRNGVRHIQAYEAPSNKRKTNDGEVNI